MVRLLFNKSMSLKKLLLANLLLSLVKMEGCASFHYKTRTIQSFAMKLMVRILKSKALCQQTKNTYK